MKARNENGTIVFYTEIPVNYKSESLGLVLGFETLDISVHEAEGFFDEVTPEFDPYTQRLSPVYFDEVNKVFTYTVEQLEEPIPKSLQERYITQNEFIKRFSKTEFTNILTLSKSNVDIEYWIFRFNSLRQGVNLNDPETIQGLHDLETAQILAAGRANEILQL